MITEDQLEQLAIQWFQDTGWSYVNGKVISPEGEAPQREDFRSVVLNGRLAEAVRVSPLQGCECFMIGNPGCCPGLSHFAPLGRSDSSAPTGHPEIARGRAQRRPGNPMQSNIQALKGRNHFVPADPVKSKPRGSAPSGRGIFAGGMDLGRCPRLSHCTPLGLLGFFAPFELLKSSAPTGQTEIAQGIALGKRSPKFYQP